MKTKLTLSVDEELVRFAHQLARRSGQSVSDMVSTFLSERQQHAKQKAVPSVDEMVGSLKGYNIDDSKSAIRAAHAEKYLG